MIREVREIEESMLWEETGRQMAARGKQEEADPRRVVVFVLGDKSAGKSAVIKLLRNDFDPQTKPNSLIEYWPSKVGLDKKQLVHFYEIGNPELAPFFECFCRQDTRIYFLLCLDLTQPSRLTASSSAYLQRIRQVCKKRPEPEDQRQRRTGHGEADSISPLPAYVTVVGTKFDLFEKLELEAKKWIARSLRFLAHTNSCSIACSSSKNNQLGLQFRSTFADLLAKNQLPTKPNFKDFAKPLFAAFGEDKISDMSLPSSGSLSSLQVLEKQLQSIQKPEEKGEKGEKREKLEKASVKSAGRLDEALQKRRGELVQLLRKGLKQGVQLV